jgi:arginase family enzyme
MFETLYHISLSGLLFFDLQLDSTRHLTFDMNWLDPAFAPGISHREPGGLSTREALRMIQSLRANIIGTDVAEFNPSLDTVASGGIQGATAKRICRANT